MASNVTSFLEKLGLTEYEAKALDALFKLNEAEAPNISRNAQVPKTRVYDVLDRLVKKNLIIEIYGRPKKYKVIEPGKAFTFLLQQKMAEINELEKQTQKILNELTVKDKDSFEEKVLKVKTENDFHKILGQELESAKKSIQGFTKASEQTSLHNALKKAAQRNVQIKLLHKALPSEMVKELNEAGVKAKNLDHSLNAFVIDEKKVILALNDFSKASPEYHFTIYNNNKEMVSLLKHYFDRKWR